jgi:hypothetical protein
LWMIIHIHRIWKNTYDRKKIYIKIEII